MKGRTRMIKLPKIYKQTTLYTCGPAALAMVFGYYGIEKSEEELVELAKTTQENGTENKDMVRVAQELGLDAEYKKESSIAELKQFVDRGIPIIVLWFSPEEGGHFSVVVEVNSDEVVMADSLLGGERRMKIIDFLNRWFELDDYPPQNPANFTLREIIVIRK